MKDYMNNEQQQRKLQEQENSAVDEEFDQLQKELQEQENSTDGNLDWNNWMDVDTAYNFSKLREGADLMNQLLNKAANKMAADINPDIEAEFNALLAEGENRPDKTSVNLEEMEKEHGRSGTAKRSKPTQNKQNNQKKNDKGK